LASLVWKQVQKEPVVCESSFDDPSSETLIADLRVRGVWEPQVDTIFDVRIVDTDALSYSSHTPQAVIQSAEVEKKESTPLLVRLVLLVLHHFVLVWMVCLAVKQISF